VKGVHDLFFVFRGEKDLLPILLGGENKICIFTFCHHTHQNWTKLKYFGDSLNINGFH